MSKVEGSGYYKETVSLRAENVELRARLEHALIALRTLIDYVDGCGSLLDAGMPESGCDAALNAARAALEKSDG